MKGKIQNLNHLTKWNFKKSQIFVFTYNGEDQIYVYIFSNYENAIAKPKKKKKSQQCSPFGCKESGQKSLQKIKILYLHLQSLAQLLRYLQKVTEKVNACIKIVCTRTRFHMFNF